MVYGLGRPLHLLSADRDLPQERDRDTARAHQDQSLSMSILEPEGEGDLDLTEWGEPDFLSYDLDRFFSLILLPGEPLNGPRLFLVDLRESMLTSRPKYEKLAKTLIKFQKR